MGIERDESQGPAASAPDTKDGLYPTLDGDLGHQSSGDTDSLPNSNEPHPQGAEAAVSEPKQGTDDSDLEDAGLDEEGRPTGGNF